MQGMRITQEENTVHQQRALHTIGGGRSEFHPRRQKPNPLLEGCVSHLHLQLVVASGYCGVAEHSGVRAVAMVRHAGALRQRHGALQNHADNVTTAAPPVAALVHLQKVARRAKLRKFTKPITRWYDGEDQGALTATKTTRGADICAHLSLLCTHCVGRETVPVHS
jgi:hypothetical protein